MQSENGKDPLLGNKIAGAILAALLLFFGLPQVTGAIFGGGGHHGGGEAEELHLAYCCVELETEAGGGEEEEAPADLGTLLADASAAAGERRAALCKSCHTFEEGGPNGTGPNLWGVVGRQVASHAGFNYTSALKEAGGAWTYERLDEFLHDSQSYVPGTAMVQRFPKDDQRADILAYLGTLSNNPVPYPEPAAAPVAEEEPAAESEEGDAAGAEASEPAEEVAADDGEETTSTAEGMTEEEGDSGDAEEADAGASEDTAEDDVAEEAEAPAEEPQE